MIKFTRAVLALKRPAAAYTLAFLRHNAGPCRFVESGQTTPVKPEVYCVEAVDLGGRIFIVQDKLADLAEARRA